MLMIFILISSIVMLMLYQPVGSCDHFGMSGHRERHSTGAGAADTCSSFVARIVVSWQVVVMVIARQRPVHFWMISTLLRWSWESIGVQGATDRAPRHDSSSEGWIWSQAEESNPLFLPDSWYSGSWGDRDTISEEINQLPRKSFWFLFEVVLCLYFVKWDKWLL